MSPARGIVQLWLRSLQLDPDALQSCADLLSPDEHARAARRIDPESGKQVIAARGQLRQILGSVLQRDPKSLQFHYGEHGKPELSDRSLQFNVSHSGPWVMVAVSAPDVPVGIDIERIRERLDFERLAQRFFSAAEVATLMSVPASDRRHAFFNCWTRKEAFIKVKGVGLALPLNQFDVTLRSEDPVQLLATRPDPRNAARFELRALEAPHGYRAALATEGEISTIEFPDPAQAPRAP